MEQNNSNDTWVKLHLVPQTEGSYMPTHIIGVLTQETATAYVLTNVLAENDDFELEPSEGMSFINRTYVWRCEVLPYVPTFGSESEEYNGEGGLG